MGLSGLYITWASYLGAVLVDGQMGVVLKAISLGIIKNPYEQLKRPDAVYN